MIQCRLCNLQYTGETKRRLKGRFNEHRRPILNPSGSYIQTSVSEHFPSNSHSVSHMLLIPIETLRYESDCLRKAREAHLIHKAKAIEPLGMNKRNEQYLCNLNLFFGYFSYQPHLTMSYHETSVYFFFTVVYILYICCFS